MNKKEILKKIREKHKKEKHEKEYQDMMNERSRILKNGGILNDKEAQEEAKRIRDNDNITLKDYYETILKLVDYGFITDQITQKRAGDETIRLQKDLKSTMKEMNEFKKHIKESKQKGKIPKAFTNDLKYVIENSTSHFERKKAREMLMYCY